MGSLLKTQYVEGNSNRVDINLSDVEAGIYVAEIATKSGKLSKKLIKQ